MSDKILQPFALSPRNGLLGRYYVGDNCAESPPHITRVDRQIEFEDIAHMGAMPFPSCDLWTGELIAPTAGSYEFTIDVDDSGWLTIDNTKVIRDPGAVNKSHDAGRINLKSSLPRIC